MDTQLKKRLTGAVILVILAVLIVPALLTGPKAPAERAAAPDDSAPIRSYTIDLTAATPPRATDGPAAAPTTATASPSAQAQPSATPPAAASASPPAPTLAPAPGVPAAMTSPMATPAAAAASKPVSPVSPATGFAVQLGSFANVDTAKRLASDLRARGYKVSLAPVQAGGRQLQRVRVGPVATRAAAEALAIKLAAAGHKGPVVPFP